MRFFGKLLRAYNHGRRDAKLGQPRQSYKQHGGTYPLWAQYAQGYSDERARMARTGQLPQGDLFHAAGVAT